MAQKAYDQVYVGPGTPSVRRSVRRGTNQPEDPVMTGLQWVRRSVRRVYRLEATEGVRRAPLPKGCSRTPSLRTPQRHPSETPYESHQHCAPELPRTAKTEGKNN